MQDKNRDRERTLGIMHAFIVMRFEVRSIGTACKIEVFIIIRWFTRNQRTELLDGIFARKNNRTLTRNLIHPNVWENFENYTDILKRESGSV